MFSWSRTFIATLLLYAFVNGSGFSLVAGAAWLFERVNRIEDPLLVAVGHGGLWIVIVLLLAIVSRLMNMNGLRLVSHTAGLAAALVIIALFAANWLSTFPRFDYGIYTAAFRWLWQIPVGLFIGSGLIWSILNGPAHPIDDEADEVRS